MSRTFSTSAKALLNFIWNGISPRPEWEERVRKAVEGNLKLPSIDTVKVKYAKL